MAKSKTKSKSQTDLVRHWELSPIGRRILREGRQFKTVRRIVMAARRVFAQRGLAGARMDEIARVAGVNKALPYYYFCNIEELHRFVLETMIAQISAQMESPAVLSMDPPARVRALVNLTFDFVMRNPAYPRLIQREMMAARRPLHWMVVAYHRPLHKRAVKTIREGIASGQFRAVDPDQMVFTIFGWLCTILLLGSWPARFGIVISGILETSNSAAAPCWIFSSTACFWPLPQKASGTDGVSWRVRRRRFYRCDDDRLNRRRDAGAT